MISLSMPAATEFFTVLLSVISALLVVILFRFWMFNRLEADAKLAEKSKIMFEKLNTLLDAKDAVDEDVPDILIEQMVSLAKLSNKRGIGFKLFYAVKEAGRTGVITQTETRAAVETMRAPLQGAYKDFLQSWSVYVANTNLLARFLIREQMGKLAEKSQHDPYKSTRVGELVVKRMQKDVNGACAA